MPANMEGAIYIGLCPIHDPAKLVPVVHFLKGHLLHRRAGDDHTVVFPVLYLIKGVVELVHVTFRGVLGSMTAYLQKVHIHLQWRVAQQTQQLGLRVDLGGHQI